MRTVQSRDAKAGLSALIEAAERGEPTTITRHGRPAAVLVPVEPARQLYPDADLDFTEFLLSFPGGTSFERDRTPLRTAEF